MKNFIYAGAAVAALTTAASAQAQSLAPTPARQTGGSISNADYPREALLARAEGSVQIRLAINEDGRVAECTIVEPSSHPALDATTCALVQRRFRFAPATIGGRPNATTLTRRVTWHLPARPSAPAAPGT